MHVYHNLKVISTFSEIILLTFLYSSERKVLKTCSTSALVCLGKMNAFVKRYHVLFCYSWNFILVNLGLKHLL